MQAGQKSNFEVHPSSLKSLDHKMSYQYFAGTYQSLDGPGVFQTQFSWKGIGKRIRSSLTLLLQSKLLNCRLSWRGVWKRSRTTLIQFGFSSFLKGQDTRRRSIWLEKNFRSHAVFLCWSTAWSHGVKAGASQWQILRRSQFHGCMMSPFSVKRHHLPPSPLYCWAKLPRLTCTSGDLNWKRFQKMRRAQPHGYRVSSLRRTPSWINSKAQEALTA